MIRILNKCLNRALFWAALGGLTACSSFSLNSQAPRRLVGERQWVRATTKDNYVGPQKTEAMSPILWKELVIQGNGIDGIAAFDRKSGQLRWRTDITNGIAGNAQLQDDKLYFGASDGQFYSLDASDGHVIWTFPARAETLGGPLVTNGKVYFLAGNNILYAIDANTGKQIWIYNRPETTSLSVRGGSTPALVGSTLYVGFSDGYMTAVNEKDGSLVWERQLNSNPRFRDVDGSPVIDGDYVYAASYDGALFCLSRGDGQIVWRLEEGGHTPVTIVGDRLYYSSSTNKVFALEKKTGKVIWSRDVEAGVATQPISFKNLVAIGESSGTLKVLNTADGSVVYSYAPGWGIFARPTYDEATGDLFAMSTEANLHVIRLAWKQHRYETPWEGIE